MSSIPRQFKESHQHFVPAFLGNKFTPVDETPRCKNETQGRCEIWVPSPAFSLPTEPEKRLAAKQFGASRGQEGWYYARDEIAETPGWIVARRRVPQNAESVETL